LQLKRKWELRKEHERKEGIKKFYRERVQGDWAKKTHLPPGNVDEALLFIRRGRVVVITKGITRIIS
jgi:hypothetical protein